MSSAATAPDPEEVRCVKAIRRAGEGGDGYLSSLKECLELATKGIVRDAMELEEKTFVPAFKDFIRMAVGYNNANADTAGMDDDAPAESMVMAHKFITACMSFPEFTKEIYKGTLTPEIVALLMTRSGCYGEGPFVSEIIIKTYREVPEIRGNIRCEIGRILQSSTKAFNPTQSMTLTPRQRAAGAATALEVCLPLIKGFNLPLTKQNTDLLLTLILPLHNLPGKLSHRKPLLQIVHQPLVRAIHAFLEKNRHLYGKAIRSLIGSWPSRSAGNTPKEVLLITELSTLLQLGNSGTIPVELTKMEVAMVVSRLAGCIGSPNSLVSQSALRLFKSQGARSLLAADKERLIESLVRPILIQCLDHWNETVRKMSLNVLQYMIELDADAVTVAATRVWGFSGQEKAKAKLEVLLKDHADDKKDSNVDVAVSFSLPLSSSSSSASSSSSSPSSSSSSTAPAPTSSQPPPPASLSAASSSTPSSMPTPTPAPERQKLTLFDLVFGRELGRGSFAKVRYAQRIVKGRPRSRWKEYAVKEIDKNLKKVALREMEVMKRLNGHPNLITFVDYFESQRYVHIVTEYAKLGDLHGLVSRLGPLTNESARFVTAEILNGLVHIHAHGYVYGDLKPENVLLMENDHVKIADFGASRRVDECKDGAPIEGTPIYLPPEVLLGKASNFATDWWSLGCVVFYLLSGGPPEWVASAREDTFNDIEAVTKGTVQFDVKERDVFPEHFPTPAKRLVLALLAKEPQHRLGYLPEVKQHSHGAEQQDRKRKEEEDGSVLIKAHEFYTGISFVALSKQTPPKMKGSGAPRPANSAWSRRSFSIMHAPMPEVLDLTAEAKIDSTLQQAIKETTTERFCNWLGGKLNVGLLSWRPTPPVPRAGRPSIPLAGRSTIPLTGVMPRGRGGRRMAPPRAAIGRGRAFSGQRQRGGNFRSILAKRRKNDFIASLHGGAG